MSEYYGCGNKNCVVEKPVGVGTLKIPCKCLDDLAPHRKSRILMRLRELQALEAIACKAVLREGGNYPIADDKQKKLL